MNLHFMVELSSLTDVVQSTFFPLSTSETKTIFILLIMCKIRVPDWKIFVQTKI